MTEQGRATGPQRSPLLTTVAVVSAVLAVAALAWVLVSRDTSETPASKTPAALSKLQVVEVATTRQALAEGATAIDVRTPREYAAGHLQSANNLDLSAKGFDQQISALDPRDDFVVYCASGRRAAEAIQQMRNAGFTGQLTNSGGFEDLEDAGLDTQTG